MSGSRHRDFAEVASDTDLWFQTAEDLQFAAQQLEPAIEACWKLERQRSEKRASGNRMIVFVYAPDPRSIYLMLIAYAVENLCKGLLIARQRTRAAVDVAETGRLPDWLKGHDLLELLEKIAFPKSAEDGELANRLARAAIWSARYPVPTSIDHWSVFATTVEGQDVVPPWHKEDDVATIQDFYTRLDAYVSDRWQEL